MPLVEFEYRKGCWTKNGVAAPGTSGAGAGIVVNDNSHITNPNS